MCFFEFGLMICSLIVVIYKVQIGARELAPGIGLLELMRNVGCHVSAHGREHVRNGNMLLDYCRKISLISLTSFWACMNLHEVH